MEHIITVFNPLFCNISASLSVIILSKMISSHKWIRRSMQVIRDPRILRLQLLQVYCVILIL
jgi:hypothetical protein